MRKHISAGSDGSGQPMGKCSRCRNTFTVPKHTPRTTVCPDCDPSLATTAPEEVILEGNEADRIAKGLEALDEEAEVPIGHVSINNG